MNQDNFAKTKEIIKDTINSSKLLKVGVCISVAVIGLYALGQTLTGLSYAVDGFKRLKNSIKGT